MSYLDNGYDEFLTRLPVNTNQEMDVGTSDQLIQEISASKIMSGILKSSNGKISLDLDEGILKIMYGDKEIVRLGKLSETDAYGIEIKNKDGNVLLHFGDKNYLLSPDKQMLFDFDNNRLLISENDIPNTLLGKIT